MNGIQIVVEIEEEKDVVWFLNLVKEQSTRHLLVAYVTIICYLICHLLLQLMVIFKF